MKRSKYIFVLLLLISITVVCSVGTFFYVKVNNASREDSEFYIMTSCNPMYLATVNVVGDIDGVSVSNLSQPTTGCLHDYTLTTEDMKNLSKADVLIVNGGGMEGYLDDVIAAYPDLPIINTFEEVEDDYPILIEEESDEDEQTSTDEEHHHDEGANSHIWMSEDIYAGQVNAIAEGLAQVDSSNKAAYISNAGVFIDTMNADIDKQDLDNILAGSNVAILHEAFAYTAQSLGANVVATMDLDEERQVSAGEVSEFIQAIETNEVKIVFAEYDYGHDMGKLIEEQTDAKVVYLETLVHGSYEGLDYIYELNNNYKVIVESLTD